MFGSKSNVDLDVMRRKVVSSSPCVGTEGVNSRWDAREFSQ